ncbi:MAG: aminopeptidase P family protein, partial [Chloroflexota bacterium]|nr:aminopeptidase P family protein [Chloroflexota bacterium]
MPDKTTADPALPILFYGNSYHYPDIYRATGFLAPDPIIALEHGDEIVILASPLEQGRVEKESRATSVRSLMEFGLRELSEQGLDTDEINATVIQRFLAERRLDRVHVPRYFPVGTADRLRAKGIALEIVRDLDARRRIKRPDEVAAIEKAQRATEEAWAAGVDALRRATAAKDGTLSLDGRTLTAERLRTIVESELLARDCATPDRTITAPGQQAADPHEIGHGPLHAGEPIVMDIYPQHSSRYWADMTRTVSKGTPPDAIVRMYEVVKRAQDEGIAMLRPGISGREIHERVEDVIFEAGYDTLRPGQRHHPDDPVIRGFFHGTGHGVGLEIH